MAAGRVAPNVETTKVSTLVTEQAGDGDDTHSRIDASEARNEIMQVKNTVFLQCETFQLQRRSQEQKIHTYNVMGAEQPVSSKLPRGIRHKQPVNDLLVLR